MCASAGDAVALGVGEGEVLGEGDGRVEPRGEGVDSGVRAGKGVSVAGSGVGTTAETGNLGAPLGPPKNFASKPPSKRPTNTTTRTSGNHENAPRSPSSSSVRLRRGPSFTDA